MWAGATAFVPRSLWWVEALARVPPIFSPPRRGSELLAYIFDLSAAGGDVSFHRALVCAFNHNKFSSSEIVTRSHFLSINPWWQLRKSNNIN